jgi:hypothetical protein
MTSTMLLFSSEKVVEKIYLRIPQMRHLRENRDRYVHPNDVADQLTKTRIYFMKKKILE